MNEQLATVKSLTAYARIRELILSGELLPGTRLVLADLEEKLGVGRGPIREALMRLDKSGLVQNVPYKGAIVTPPPSFEEMEVVYQLRVLVEDAMVIGAMNNATPEDIEKIEQIAKKTALACQDEPLFFHMDREFHSKLYAIAHMHHLQIIVDRLLDHVEIFLNTRYYEPQDKELCLSQHLTIIKALKEKDQNLLRAALKQNVLVGLDLVQREMERFNRQRRPASTPSGESRDNTK